MGVRIVTARYGCRHLVLGDQLGRLPEVARGRQDMREFAGRLLIGPQVVSGVRGQRLLPVSVPQRTVRPPFTGLVPPPARRKRSTRAASGIIVINPSPMRAQTSAACGPKAGTSMGTGSSGRVYRRAFSTV